MDEIDTEAMVAAVKRAARAASDPAERDKLNAAAFLFGAWDRFEAREREAQEREREAWEIVRDVASFEDAASLECGHCFAGSSRHIKHMPECPVTRARRLLAEKRA